MSPSAEIGSRDPIASFPRVEIGSWPTPVRRLEIASAELGVDIWAKVEDATGTWCSNKVRKLECLLGEARRLGRSRLFTYGVGSSTWCAAVARYGTEQGFAVHVALAGGVPPHLAPAYRDTTLTRLPTHATLPVVAVAGRVRARGTYRLPAGGSGGLGDLGSMGAGTEIATAIDRHELPAPERIFVAAGTCGTAAGLALGLTLGGHPTDLCAARVTPRPLGTEGLLKRRLRRLIDLVGVDPAARIAVGVDEGFHHPGYGKPNRASEEARLLAARDGLELDPTYGAKAFAALVAAARAVPRGPLLFVSTSPIGSLRV